MRLKSAIFFIICVDTAFAGEAFSRRGTAIELIQMGKSLCEKNGGLSEIHNGKLISGCMDNCESTSDWRSVSGTIVCNNNLSLTTEIKLPGREGKDVR